MNASIEIQVISKILTSDDEELVATLCGYDHTYYEVFKPQINYILDHLTRYGNVPDLFTFQAEFPAFGLVDVSREPLEYLTTELKKNKQRLLLVDTFNKLKDLGSADVTDAWEYLHQQCDAADQLVGNVPMNIIAEAKERADQVKEWAKQARIPTGFMELDKLLYGGWSTVEEFAVIVAGTNSGKSWFCAKSMEAAHRAGFPVALYSPEMQAAYFGTRFDTWRGHFKNSELFQGKYTDDYNAYIEALRNNPVPAFIIEDKDMPEGVSPRHLGTFIKKNKIKLLIIDGISYMSDDKRATSDYERQMHIAKDLFNISKKYGCAILVAAQANRETKDTKDEKGNPFPDLYHIAGSFAIAQVATLGFAIRQIFDKQVFEIRAEKARNSKNNKTILSYSWDINTGNMQYMQGDASEDPTVNTVDTANILPTSNGPVPDIIKDLDLGDADSDVEF